MINEQIREYVENSRKAGYTDDQIKEALKKSGWNDDQISEALSVQAPEPVPQTPIETGQPSSDERKYNTLAIVSFIFTFVFWPVGLILGIVALSKIKKTGEKGKGLAIAAIVLPLIFMGVFLLAFGAYFGVLDPAKMLPDRCQFSAGLDCIDFAAVESDSVTFALRNNMGYPITIDSVTADGCSSAEVSPTLTADYTELGATVENNMAFRIRLTGCNNGRSGNRYDSQITIKYTSTETGLHNTVVGEIRAKVA